MQILSFFSMLDIECCHCYKGCRAGAGVGVVRSRRFLGVVGVAFLTTLGVGVGVGFFVRLRLRTYNWIIVCVTLLNWEFLLKWYNFVWSFCWNRFLAVHHSFHWLEQPNFIPFMLRSRESEILENRSRKFWNVGSGVRVGYFTSDSATLIATVTIVVTLI